ncbi:hypothetical protein [Micromonospora qiuiae]|uniref:hypothetical protein n=1 Tax=Micromonospora qiuiae TaxID=502268 RepID=UPI001EF18EC4|nr:hypothetical protein [Micromonospora qiuiae]
MNRQVHLASGLVFAAMWAVGCAPTGDPGVPAPQRSGPVYPIADTGDGPPSPAGEQPGVDDHGDDRPPVAPPPAAQAAPVAAAFAAAWARPDLPAETWWRGVASRCDEGFAHVLRTVDPARVPATRVTGRPVAKQAPKNGAAVYEVTTDSGTLTVRLAGVGGRWVVTGNDFTRSVSR